MRVSVLVLSVLAVLGGVSQASATFSSADLVHVWKASKWSTCSTACGGSGVQNRLVACQNGKGVAKSNSLCTAAIPSCQRPCNRQSCDNRPTTCTAAQAYRQSCAAPDQSSGTYLLCDGQYNWEYTCPTGSKCVDTPSGVIECLKA